ncbi:rod shape-determining protein RodA [Arenicella xantha]|uniref:Peptidoglycan glycosyltransferase MrdB n=1 Tax=Arenicella xantha TaxID=644221 RepID=A0A395JQC4_9GAMM|nr:rod shape-determining protein RodA [Arenicella xantha]RBP50920.1 cell elongation-specific peptidoglycan biosynthesis regulator RodA [Arenicella xantha]
MVRLKVDLPILFGLLLLCAGSLLILWSAGGENSRLIWNQAIRMGVAFFGMLVIAQIRTDTLFRWSPYFYFAGLVMLVLVLLVGDVGKGAQRWLDFGVIRFQPSEAMKIAVPMMVAWVVTRKTLPPPPKNLFYAALVLLLPSFLILKQPDLGTTLLILMSGSLIIFLAGFAWKYIAILFGAAAIAAPVLYQFLHPYQQRRIQTLFDPWSDPLGNGYHTIQSMIAIGSGGAQGKGWTEGSQSQLDFIPERHTDFIFSVFSEEHGFIGALMLLTLYLALTARGLYIAYYTKDTFSRLLAGSLSMTFFFYVFVNIGMVSGMLPVVGVPLPLISYGGTSMVTLLAGFGILMGIHNTRSLMSR